MIFWIFAAFLTFVAALCVLVPLWRVQPRSVSNIEYDKALYKARVVEIEKDVSLGRLTPEAAKTAISEEGRKLISLADFDGQTGKNKPSGKWFVRMAQSYGLVFLPLAAIGIYLSLGNPEMPDAGLASRLSVPPEQQSIDDLVARAEAHLSKNPQDVRGWAVLAPVYSRLGRAQDALNAWSSVYRLAPQTPEIRATLGESMIAAANGVVTSEARQLFEAELKANSASAKARFYLAMAFGQEGKHKQAVAAWQELIKGGSNESPWMEAAQEFMAQSAKAANIEVSPGIAGPSQEQVEAASEMTAEDRNEMISGMVAGLAERLEAEPDNKQGWQQLIRSYKVLGRNSDAELAIANASEVFKDDQAFLESLKSILSAGN